MYAAAISTDGFVGGLKRQIMIGTYIFVLLVSIYDAYYTQAQKAWMMIAYYFKQVYTSYDLLLPAIPSSEAFDLSGPNNKSDDLIVVYFNDVLTVSLPWAELPTMSALGRLAHQSLPLRIQVIGHPLDEQGILNAGLPIKECAGFVARAGCWW